MPPSVSAVRNDRKRLPAAERIELLKDLAAEAFADRGYSISTRDIAGRCGVTQALLYKYFGSKAKLIEAVLEKRFLTGRSAPDTSLLSGPGPLEDRIAAFYANFVEQGTAINVRLFLRAALDGLDLPTRYGTRLDEWMLKPVLNALRAEIGVAPTGETPLPPDERELAMMLHGCAVFSLIRREIYGTQFHSTHADLVRQHVRIWVPGACDEIRRLVSRH